MRYFYYLLLLSLFLAFSCVPESKKILTEVNIDSQNKVFQAITNHQYAGNTDSLLNYFNSKLPTERYLAAKAFASHQDKSALDSLYKLLDDPIVKVRSMAAYSIGQIKDPSSEQHLIKGFRQKDTMSVDNSGNAAILTSVGKTGAASLANFITDADGYRDTDTLLIVGQMKSLYHFALRGIVTPEMITKAVETVRTRQLPQKMRLYAAHMLARPKILDIESVKFQIAEAYVDEQDTNIKMALASALRHTNDPEIQATLLTQLDLEQDYRVVCNTIRSLSNYNYQLSKDKIISLLRSDNVHIANVAVEFLRKSGIPADVYAYREVAKDSLPWQVKTNLYEAISKLTPHYYSKTKNATRWHIQQAMESDSTIYGTIGYIKALGQDPESYGYLIKVAEDSEDPRIKTAATEALGSILAREDFNSIYQSFSRSNRRKILAHLMDDLASEDEGRIGAAANAIADPNSGLKALIDSTQFLLDAKARLQMPGQIESIHAVEKALAHMRGVTKPVLTKANNFKQTNWSLLTEHNDKTKAIIKTNKGIIEIAFRLDEAPGSVLNFIQLSLDNYFDNKIFHRVVPNFVIQTGSPRGDNYGGADYVISSDVGSGAYDDEGYVGMASAGLHTESTQWFITHSPTPHLDGNYSIFAKVTKGMDVVHNIQVGDEILDVIITKL